MFDSDAAPDGVPAEGAVDAATWAELVWPFDDVDDHGAPPPPPLEWEVERLSAGEVVRSLCGVAAGADLLSELSLVEVADLSADEAVTLLQEVQRAASWLAGFEAQTRALVTGKVVAEVQVRLDAEAVGGQSCRPQFVCAEQVAWSEVTAALRLSPRAGESRILEAEELAGRWRPLLDAMLTGVITLDHTRAIGRQLRYLPGYGSGDPAQATAYATSCREVLAAVVPFAATHTPGESGRKTAVLVTAKDPTGARQRRRTAAERDHGVFVNPVEPGTSQIRALMPTAHADAVMQAVTTLAKDARFEVAEGCITTGQRQVAALVALTLGDPGSVGQITGPVSEAKLNVHVTVLVPIDTLAGSHACGRIGTTPTTGDEVRDLVAHAALQSSTIRRLVTDSAGCILDAGRRHYLASDLQKLVLRLRDQTCRFPGCSRDAERCEIDHATPWDAGGRSDRYNLGPLCKHHHQLKTAGHWHIITSGPDGSCTWRSPLGRIYQHTPPDLTPPRPPEPTPPDDPPPF